MKKYLCIIFIFCSIFSKGQNPLVKMWDYRFGGTMDDNITCFQQTRDGGYILGGFSRSAIGGDKTQVSQGFSDYWIVKTDFFGNKQWEKDFGGTNDDLLWSLQQTNDGGFILGGYSSSGISGDKTQTSWGGADYWIVKTDSLGNKQWDKDFGGTDTDELFSIQQTSDGGFILGGYTLSGISGNKTQATRGAHDFWIIKTDLLGIKQWDVDFGGTSDDIFYSLAQTSDSGYIFGGRSLSGIGGDKTQPCWGNNDEWIIKIDSLGNKQWDKDFGGVDGDNLSSVKQTSDGGYILGGYSYSGISGDKTEAQWGGGDYWIIKTDSYGVKQWDKDFGGSNNEYAFGNITQTSDKGYLMSGYSLSNTSGDKTEDNLGGEQTWIVKIDSLGNKDWDKTIFTTGYSQIGLSIQTAEGCYVFATYDRAGIGGYKTQANWDTTNATVDYWFLKFCDSTFLQPTAIAITDSLLCPGTCTNFTNLSLNATSYIWFFPGALPDSSSDSNPTNICYATPGSYDVQLIASNANGSDTLLLTNYITVYPTPPPQSITQIGDTLFAIAGSASYQWYYNGNIINGATDYFYLATQNGDYNVVATDMNGCEVEAAVFNVMTSVQAIGDQELLIFPNPVEDKVKIHKSQGTRETALEISVYNVMNEMVLAVDLPIAYCLLPTCSIDVSELRSGLYFLEFTTDNKTYRTKFIKQ